MSNTISFDRAANFYDQTRGFPPGVADEASALIVQTAELHPTSAVMEIAVGTGRIALPLARQMRGPVHGIDISMAMMENLLAKRDDEPVLPVQADAGKLPYADMTFDALLAVHIFHLLPDFPPVEVEMRRVLKPNGVVIQCWNTNDSTLSRVRRRFSSAMRHGAQNEDRWERSNHYLTSAGWTETRHSTIPYITHETPQYVIDGFENRRWSGTWVTSDEDLRRGVEAMREELIAQYGDLTQPIEVQNEFHVAVYAKP